MAFKMKYRGSSPYPQKKAWEDLGDEEKEKEGKRFGPVDDKDWAPPQPEPGKLRIDKDKDKDDTPWVEAKESSPAKQGERPPQPKPGGERVRDIKYDGPGGRPPNPNRGPGGRQRKDYISPRDPKANKRRETMDNE